MWDAADEAIDASPAGVDLVNDMCEEEEIIYEVDPWVVVTSLWPISRSIFSSLEARLNVLLNRRIRNIWISTIPELCNRTATTPVINVRVIDVHGKRSVVGPTIWIRQLFAVWAGPPTSTLFFP